MDLKLNEKAVAQFKKFAEMKQAALRPVLQMEQSFAEGLATAMAVPDGYFLDTTTWEFRESKKG